MTASSKLGIPRRAVLSALSSIALLATALHAPANSQDLKPVSLRMDTFYYGAHAPLLLGIVDGIYARHGLDVTANTGRGSANTIQTVAAGTDDFGFADGGVLVRFAAQGLKAKQIVGMLQANPSIILTYPDSGIEKPVDLNGRRGGFGVGSAPEQLFPAFISATGVDGDSLQRVSVDLPTRDNLFVQKEIEFTFGYTVLQLPLLQERCGCELHTLSFAENGVKSVSNGIVVGDNYAEANPEIVRKFAQATVEAIELAVDQPERAVDAFFEYADESQLSREVVREQWLETIKLLKTEATRDQSYGVMSMDDWAMTIETLENYAELPEGSVTPDMVATNEYLEGDGE